MDDSAPFLSPLCCSKCYASCCNLYKLLRTTQLEVVTGEKEPRIYGDWRQRNSTLERRPRVRATGCGSFSPVATFKLCSSQELVQVNTSLRNTYCNA